MAWKYLSQLKSQLRKVLHTEVLQLLAVAQLQ